MANGAAIYVDLATKPKTIDALKSPFAKLIVGAVSQQNSLDVFMTNMEGAQQSTAGHNREYRNKHPKEIH